MKLWLYEGGIRVPGILRFPGRIQPGSESDEPVCGLDVLPTLTALENVAFMAELAGMGAPKERAEAMLEAVGLADRRHAFPESLSGGEQQRVAVARALVHAPAAVLADEPTGNLDSQTAETVAEVLFTQTRAAGASLVLVTHDPALAAQADRTLALGGP